MTVLTQLSYTSMKKFLIASSVAALVGFAPMDVEAREEAADDDALLPTDSMPLAAIMEPLPPPPLPSA